jgi:hypothetical protein
MIRNKRPNALKAHAFATPPFKEFEKLASDLAEEWVPIGRTEEDAVLTMAHAMWRKSRVQRYLEAEIAKTQTDPDHPLLLRYAAKSFCSTLCTLPKRFELIWSARVAGQIASSYADAAFAAAP